MGSVSLLTRVLTPTTLSTADGVANSAIRYLSVPALSPSSIISSRCDT